MSKKYKFLFYYCFLGVFLLFSISFCYAVELNVLSYPSMPGNNTVTASTTVPEYLKYVFNFGIFVGFAAAFLSLVWAGVLYTLSPAIPSALANAKERITGTISGLLILVLLYLIITTINPALAFFKTTQLQALPPPPASSPPSPGVYLYKYVACLNPDPSPTTQSIPDLSSIKLNKDLRSIRTRYSTEQNAYYFAFLYENSKFRGKCLMVGYNTDCKIVLPFASSVDIHKYSFTAKGDITIYRNSSFNKEGGYFSVKSSDIQNTIRQQKTFMINLNNTRFIDATAKNKEYPDGCTVPKEQQDCIKYDKNGKCAQDGRICPTLAGENIGSIKIDGNYFVLLVYYNPDDPQTGQDVKKEGTWNFCQSYPAIDDVNRIGPRQIQWEDVRNQGSTHLPNWMLIIPVENE